MKKHFIILIIGLLTVSFVYAQIPIEAYRKEIRALKTEKEISKYWGSLYKIDQEVLLNTPNLKRADSISVSNMIKTALIFDIHGTKGYNINGESAFLSIINLSHNHKIYKNLFFSTYALKFLPLKCVKPYFIALILAKL